MPRIIRSLDKIIYWSIVIIPFSISIAPAFTNTIIGILFFFFILKKILMCSPTLIKTPINLPFVLLGLFTIISFINSIDYQASIRGVLKLLQNAALFLICAEEIKDKQQIKLIISSIILGASLSSLDGIWQTITGKDFIRGHTPVVIIGLKRSTAAFPNPNVMGVYLSAILPLIVGISLYYFQGRLKILMLGVSTLGLFGLLLTCSRGAVLGLYAGMFFLSKIRKDKLLLILLIVILLIFPFIMPKNIKDWARQVNYNPIIFMCNPDRISLYRNSLNMIKHHPLIGVGINTFAKNYFTYKLPEPEGAQTGDHMYAHNNFLQMGGEIGLLGLGAFLWLLLRLFKYGMRIYCKLNEQYLKIISISLIACLLSFLINGLTETSLYYSRVAMIFWFLIGFLLSLDKFILRTQA